MEKSSSRNVVLMIVLLFIIVVSVIGLTFAFFQYSRTSTTSTDIRTAVVQMGYIEEKSGISLTNAMPISDDDALGSTDLDNYFDFNVNYEFPTSTTLSYEIDIEDITSRLDGIIDKSLTSVSSDRIKVALASRTTDGSVSSMVVNPVYFSNLEDSVASNSKPGFKLLEKEVVGKNVDYYRLYLWIPENDVSGQPIPLVDMDEVGGIRHQAFSVRVNVQALAKVNE